MKTTPRQRYIKRFEALKGERALHLARWRELSDHILPWRSRFLLTDRNRPSNTNKIINNTPTQAADTTAAGLMSGASNPSRPWFRLATPTPGLETPAAKAWIYDVEVLMRDVFDRSNLYNALHTAYLDLVVFGITAIHIEDDDERVINATVYSIGQYALASSKQGTVDTVYRELSMTVEQLVSQFGYDACSDGVQKAYDRDEYDEWVEVLHVVEPNRDYREGKLGPIGKRFKSCWMETGAPENAGFLREAGYENMPTLCPRWQVRGEDVYGHGPGSKVLSDCKALQKLMRDRAHAFDLTIKPPMVGPAAMLGRQNSLVPGAFIPEDAMAGPGRGFRPAIEYNPAGLSAAAADVAEHEKRINDGLGASTWTLLANAEGTMTAREVAERSEEKMMQLGPALERLHAELFKPLIDRVFGILKERELLPPPPEELQGVDLRVQFISILAQAQKALGITAIDRLATFVLTVIQAKPEIADVFNEDASARAYAEALGTPPELINDPDTVKQKREARAQRAAQEQQMQQAAALAQGAQTLSKTSMEGDTGLTRILGAYGGAPPAAA